LCQTEIGSFVIIVSYSFLIPVELIGHQSNSIRRAWQAQ